MHFAVQQATSFRAPIQFLRYRYRIQQLAAAEGLEPHQLALELGRGSGWRSVAEDDAGLGTQDIVVRGTRDS